nr:hypothetical protein [uncultured Butyrivibrio sp.]
MPFVFSYKVIINIVLFSGLAISYFIYKLVLKKHAEDPDFEKKEEERIRILRAKQKEEAELDEYMVESEGEYADEDE